MEAHSILWTLAGVCLVSTLGCDITDPPTVAEPSSVQASAAVTEVPAPAGLVTVASGGSSLELWPFTATTLGAPASDPVNLLLPGVDVRTVRAALLMLDGDRSAFGPLAAFDCTWKEAMGANQAAYATPSGWTGSAIQLECGDYGPVRFHVRAFPTGDWTIANAHFEVQITGTNEHEVLSWELAEQLVAADLVRAGVLESPPAPSAVITPAPTYREINPLVYNGLPAQLKALIAGPDVAVDPVPIANDGHATILAFEGSVTGERSVARREFVLEFDQTIPKPFCVQGPFDYLSVSGPIYFSQSVVVSGSGNFMSRFHARGGLELTPINPLTGEVTGETLMARVAEQDRSVVTDAVTLASSLQLQLILPVRDPASGSLRATLHVGPGGSDHATLEISCAS